MSKQILAAAAAILLWLATTIPLNAQPSPAPQIQYVTADPTGNACGATSIRLRTPNGVLYTCQSGVYAAASSSAGSGFLASKGSVSGVVNYDATLCGGGAACTFTLSMTGNVTSGTLTVPSSGTGQIIVFRITESGSGGYTFACPTNVTGCPSPTLPETALNTIVDITTVYNGTNAVFVSAQVSFSDQAGCSTYLEQASNGNNSFSLCAPQSITTDACITGPTNSHSSGDTLTVTATTQTINGMTCYVTQWATLASATNFIDLSIGGGPLFGAGFTPSWALNTVGATTTGGASYLAIALSQTGTVTIIRQFRFPTGWSMSGTTTFKATVSSFGASGNIKLDVTFSCQDADFTGPTYSGGGSTGSTAITSSTVATELSWTVDVSACQAAKYAVIKLNRDNAVGGNVAGGLQLLSAGLEQ